MCRRTPDHLLIYPGKVPALLVQVLSASLKNALVPGGLDASQQEKNCFDVIFDITIRHGR